MYTTLYQFTQRPVPFSRSTARELWTRPHIARQMLTYHLNPETELASRSAGIIDGIVTSLDDRFSLNGKRVCDLGCGPGLYTSRFAALGAEVTGVDFSRNSLEYAEKEAGRNGQEITYIHADYVEDALPGDFDLVTFIYYDYGVLSPEHRRHLLTKIHSMLRPGGYLALDALGMGSFSAKRETTAIEHRLMNGFWSEKDYIGLQRTLLYSDDAVSLDHYVIIEPGEHWEIYNWLQHFTPDHLADELEQAGFSIEAVNASLAGDALTDTSETIAVIARK
ncbi:class I SAM-dependent methyltransferase [bacterium]|nr:class I SAM-dependent methyltransferase [bacterium]